MMRAEHKFKTIFVGGVVAFIKAEASEPSSNFTCISFVRRLLKHETKSLATKK